MRREGFPWAGKEDISSKHFLLAPERERSFFNMLYIKLGPYLLMTFTLKFELFPCYLNEIV